MTFAALKQALKRRLKTYVFTVLKDSAYITPQDLRKVYGANYFGGQLPAVVKAQLSYGGQICVKNTGNFTWHRHHPQGKSVDLIIQLDGETLATVALPRDHVQPGETVTFHFAFHLPNISGSHQLVLGLVEQNVTWFAEQAVVPYQQTLTVSSLALSPTAQVFNLANRINPWFYKPSQGVYQSQDGKPFPLFVSKAKGCHLWDSEGHQYIDYIMGWGSSLLGYADERVQSAIRAVLDTGAVTPLPYPLEMEVAQMLVADIPSAEMVVFGKNGSDVCTVAARLARAHTGKRIILCSGYHGWQDFWVERMGFAVTGIPDRPEPLLYPFKFNDPDDFLQLYQTHRDDLAAVMLEPAGPNQSIQGHFQDADAVFLTTVAEAARSAGALLIFDEIVTGYRYPGGSVQQATGVMPDLTCLGKAIAAGMPLSALVGRAHIFRNMGQTHYGPTFKGEMYAFAAAKAALQIYRTEPVAEYVWDYGTRLRQGINALCTKTEVDAQCIGPPFRMGLVFNESDSERLRLKRTLYHQELLKAGILTYNGVMLPSFAHTNEVLDQTLEAIQCSLSRIATASEQGQLHQSIEIPLL